MLNHLQIQTAYLLHSLLGKILDSAQSLLVRGNNKNTEQIDQAQGLVLIRNFQLTAFLSQVTDILSDSNDCIPLTSNLQKDYSFFPELEYHFTQLNKDTYLPQGCSLCRSFSVCSSEFSTTSIRTKEKKVRTKFPSFKNVNTNLSPTKAMYHGLILCNSYKLLDSNSK